MDKILAAFIVASIPIPRDVLLLNARAPKLDAETFFSLKSPAAGRME